MAYIIQYKKYRTARAVQELHLPPFGVHSKSECTELATIDGVTYVSIPDDVALPVNQPPEIIDSIARIELPPELIREIKAASPHIAKINREVKAEIAERYPIAAEAKLLRRALAEGASDEFFQYHTFVEQCCAKGREKKAALGL